MESYDNVRARLHINIGFPMTYAKLIQVVIDGCQLRLIGDYVLVQPKTSEENVRKTRLLISSIIVAMALTFGAVPTRAEDSGPQQGSDTKSQKSISQAPPAPTEQTSLPTSPSTSQTPWWAIMVGWWF